MNDAAPAIAGAPKLGAEELAAVVMRGELRVFAPQTVVVAEGERSDALYVILSGRVRAYVSDGHGRQAMLSLLGSGEYFGEVALDDGPRSASVMTIERSTLVSLSREQVSAYLEASPAFSRHFLRKLMHHVRVLTDNVRGLALISTQGRIVRHLLENAVFHDGEHFVPGRPTQAQIASHVGCSREMVSRVFRRLTHGRYITVEARRIVIHRPPPLR